MFTVSRAGLWTPTVPRTVESGHLPESLVVDPSGRYVYVANARDSTVSEYQVDPAFGLLRSLTPATVSTGAFPQSLAIDPTGRFLYSANSNDETLSMFTVDAQTGVLKPITPATINIGVDPEGVSVDPLGRFVFAGDAGGLTTLSVDPATGVLAYRSRVSLFAGRGFPSVVEPSGHFLYAPSEAAGKLYIFSIDQQTGGLTLASSVPVGQTPSSVAIDSAGKHLYVVNRGDGTLAEFSVSSDGSLVPLPSPLVYDGGVPWQILIDPSGQLAYVSNEETALVEIYRIDAKGQLILYSTSPAGMGAGGMGIAHGRKI